MATKVDANTLAARYGFAASFFNSSPELKKLLGQAVAAQWTAEEFTARLMNTSWYKHNSALRKEWIALKAKEPAEANRRLSQRTEQVSATAQKLGLAIDSKRFKLIAENAIMYGWDDQQLNRALVSELKYNPKAALGGDIGNNQSQIRSLAAQFGVEVGEQDVFSMSKKLVEGTLTSDGITEQMRKLAKSRYRSLADDIDRGFSVQELASSYIQSQARLLEIDPAAIDFRKDTSIQKALQFQDPASKGPMALWQYEQGLRQDSRWLQTNNAHQELTDVGTKVLRDMGLMG